MGDLVRLAEDHNICVMLSYKIRQLRMSGRNASSIHEKILSFLEMDG